MYRMKDDKVFSRAEVAQHNTEDSCWIIINERVYDVTGFMKLHPGGKHTLMQVAGKDATVAFFSLHVDDVLQKYMPQLCIGTVSEPGKFKFAEPDAGALEIEVPFSEPGAFSGLKSPYYNDSHFRFRTAIRKWLQENVKPYASQWELAGKWKKGFLKKYAEAGFVAIHIVPYPTKYTDIPIPGGVDPKQYDLFHEMIVHEEMARVGHPWLTSGFNTGNIIGLPPVKYFAKPHIRDRVMREVISGEKRICLAISEPYAGSDVAGVRCRAVKSPCGQFYTVTGIKKWITTSFTSDYFTVACRSDKGMSVLLIEKGPGVTVKKQHVLGGKQANAAGTSWVIFDNVRVPADHLIGKEHQGFKVLMYNFNHERWYIAVGAIAEARAACRATLKWASLRKVFGKPLIKQPVVRQRLANMVRQVEAAHAWAESLTFQMCNMTPMEQNKYLGGPMALLKLHAARVIESVSSEAVQLFGGRSLTQTGHGAEVSRIWQQAKYISILGGSDAILADLGMKQAIRAMDPTFAKL